MPWSGIRGSNYNTAAIVLDLDRTSRPTFTNIALTTALSLGLRPGCNTLLIARSVRITASPYNGLVWNAPSGRPIDRQFLARRDLQRVSTKRGI